MISRDILKMDGRPSGDTKKKGKFASWMQMLLMPLFLRFGLSSLDWMHNYRLHRDA